MIKATNTDHYLLLNSDNLKSAAKKLNIRLAKYYEARELEPDNIEYANLTEDIWQYVYAPYDTPATKVALEAQKVYQRYNEGPQHKNSLFSSLDRLKLIFGILESDTCPEPEIGGCGFEIDSLMAIEDCPIQKIFPLHEPHLRESLSNSWIDFKSLYDLPVDLIRDYLGERYGFYYLFLQYYSFCLIFPALIGVAFFIVQERTHRVDVTGLVFLAVFMAIWSTFMLDFWKRRQGEYRVKWGQDNFNETEDVRPEFAPDHFIRNPIDATRDKYFSGFKLALRRAFSRSVIITMTTAVIGCVIGIFILRNILTVWSTAWGSLITSIINAIQIQLLNFVYSKVSIYLNDYENHRTDTEYDNALVVKNILFKFVNCMILFYFIFIFSL